MSRPIRSQITSKEVAELHEWLDSRVERTMISTQPDVACRVIELLEDNSSGVCELSSIIRTDPVLSGRVLKLANSALFARRQHVHDIEQACVLLGYNRLEQIVLGFQVASEAHSSSHSFTRRVWSMCLGRALMARELADVVSPAFARPAFVVGLMLDAGISLMPALVGSAYESRIGINGSPDVLLRAEFDTLPFTHVDVAEVMARRWRLPDVLRKPVAWHHTRPAGRRRAEPEQLLHRVAYCVGQVQRPLGDDDRDLCAQLAHRTLGISVSAAKDAGMRALAEYHTITDMLASVAARTGDMVELNRMVHAKLVEAHGEAMVQSMIADLAGNAGTFIIDGRRIVIEPEQVSHGHGLMMVAFLYDDRGQRVAAHRFHPDEENAKAICDAFVIDSERDAEFDRMELHIAAAAIPCGSDSTRVGDSRPSPLGRSMSVQSDLIIDRPAA